MSTLYRPQKGRPALQELYNSIISILNYLPSLELRGDGKTTSVTHSSAGTIVHAINQTKNLPQKKVEGGEGEQYFADNQTLRLQVIAGQNVFSIKPPPDNTKNYALVCLQGTIQWVEMQDC